MNRKATKYEEIFCFCCCSLVSPACTTRCDSEIEVFFLPLSALLHVIENQCQSGVKCGNNARLSALDTMNCLKKVSLGRDRKTSLNEVAESFRESSSCLSDLNGNRLRVHSVAGVNRKLNLAVLRSRLSRCEEYSKPTHLECDFCSLLYERRKKLFIPTLSAQSRCSIQVGIGDRFDEALLD